MAKIPLYQQNQLRSSLVGTPGVDNTLSSAFSVAARDFDAAGDAVGQVLQDDYIQNQQALRQKQIEQREAERRAKTLYNEGVASAGDAHAGIALNDLSNEIRTKYKDDITGARDEWEERSGKLRDETVGLYQDPEQKAMVQKRVNERYAQQTQSLSDYLTGRMPEISRNNATKVGDALRVSTNDATLQGVSVIKQLQSFEADPNTQSVFKTAYGAAASAEIRKHQSAAAQNFLAQVANTGDAKRLDRLIHDKQFDRYIEGTDKEQFYSRQRTLVHAAETEIRQNVEIGHTQTRINVSTAVLNTDPTNLGSLRETNEFLRSQLNAQKALDPKQRSAETVNKIETELKSNEKQIRDFGKDERRLKKQIEQDRKDEAYRLYNSPAGQKARLKLTGMQADLASFLKTSKNRQAKIERINAYAREVENVGGKAWLDPPGSIARQTSEVKFTKTAINSLSNQKQSRAAAIFGAFSGFAQQASQQFQKFAPPPGKTSLQTHDAAMTQYNSTFQSDYARYKKKYGKEPSAAVLEIMHHRSMQQGQGAALK